MKARITVSLIISSLLAISAFAQGRPDIQTQIIGSTFKILAKTYITMADLNQIKKENIDKLKTMQEDTFRKRYAKVYAVVKGLPPELKTRYGINEDMDRQEAVKKISALNKKKICEIIDGIPDQIIVQNFKEYLSRRGERIEKNNLLEQVRSSWNAIIEKMQKKR